MLGTAKLNSEITSEHRRLIAAHLRTLEESGIHLLELLRPFDSSLVRRQPLAHEKADQLQRLVARLRSGLPQAVWDLGLPRGPIRMHGRKRHPWLS